MARPSRDHDASFRIMKGHVHAPAGPAGGLGEAAAGGIGASPGLDRGDNDLNADFGVDTAGAESDLATYTREIELIPPGGPSGTGLMKPSPIPRAMPR
jgi:hypothetical protein